MMQASKQRLKLFIYARIIVSFLFLTSTLLLQYNSSTALFENFQSGVISLMTFSFLFSIISLYLLQRSPTTSFIANLQVIWDISFVTVLLLFTGGMLSPYSFLYLLSIMTAGVLLGKRQALYTASLCGIIYGTMLDFQYFGYLDFIGLTRDSAKLFGEVRLLYTIILNLTAFGLTAFITGLLAERARISEEALQRSSIDYSELTQLNSAIVAFSNTGILSVTTDGRIRVFNPYAEKITGMSLQMVYDLPVVSIFPQIAGPFSGDNPSSQQFFDFIDRAGNRLLLEYIVAPFSDSRGSLAGYVINFRDITTLREMELSLKRADRLAVVGELSARMAHEIRNPLAALSGSVQILSSNPGNSDQDVKLFAIISREAERLNELISEFLLYARPSKPKPVPVSVRKLIDENCLLLANDPRFSKMTFIKRISEESEIVCDPSQFGQVLINIMQNSADAMPDGGEITITLEENGEYVSIVVADNGPGLSQGAAEHLFEPFWTDKPAGTGLGLAISYRIIEAHGGSLSVISPAEGGSRLIISLPKNAFTYIK